MSKSIKFGLPDGFVPRLQRYGRSVLLEKNVYRLPNGDEFIPCHPAGTLGRLHHSYALVTAEQYEKRKRGSVYIRTDGRIFNYSTDNAGVLGDIFDTGYTIHDLERTGRYAPDSAKNIRNSMVRIPTSNSPELEPANEESHDPKA